jgi:hypothetical protein
MAKKTVCRTFDEFVRLFSSRLEEDGEQVILAPVRSGKTYQCEQFIRRAILNLNQQRAIVVFMTEKNVLAESSYSAIMTRIEDEEAKERVLLFEHEKSALSMKGLKSFFKRKSGENIAIISSYAYFVGDQTSQLFKTLVREKKSQNYKLVFLVDEAESLFNSFFTEIIIDRPLDKLFKVPCKGNGLTALDSSKSELLLNPDLQYSGDQPLVRGKLCAIPGNPQNFEYFSFSSYKNSI